MSPPLGRQPPPPTVNPSLPLPTRHEPPPLDDIPIPLGLQQISLPEYPLAQVWHQSALERHYINNS